MYDFNCSIQDTMPTPEALHHSLPRSGPASTTVTQARKALCDILDRRDPRAFMVVGPCSIHDPIAGLDYARRLKALQEEVSDVLFLVMRVYFEKPRTTTGWKGLINDPDLDGSFQIRKGIEQTRKFLLDVCELGLPTATEALNPIALHYLSDLVAWYAIGARTTESQTHREMASGFPTPVGFKNGTNGDIDIAVNAIRSAAYPHSFIGVNHEGRVAVLGTHGNRYGHLVLRGGSSRPNYDTVSVAMAEQALINAGLPANIVVDCSHANSYKNAAVQQTVLSSVLNQMQSGSKSLVGVMVESNLVAGSQKIPEDPMQLRYGCSITDSCIDWETTDAMIRDAAAVLRHAQRSAPDKQSYADQRDAVLAQPA